MVSDHRKQPPKTHHRLHMTAAGLISVLRLELPIGPRFYRNVTYGTVVGLGRCLFLTEDFDLAVGTVTPSGCPS